MFISVKCESVNGGFGSGRSHALLGGFSPLLIMLGGLVEGDGIVILKNLVKHKFGGIILILKHIKANIAGFFSGIIVVINTNLGEFINAIGFNLNVNYGSFHHELLLYDLKEFKLFVVGTLNESDIY